MAARDQQKVGAPPCREARSYFARAPAVKYQSCLSASANRPSISVRCSALVTGVTNDAGKGEFVSSKYCMTTFRRSEEHTSELQSLMRISYAVFCLKKKKNINNN